MRATWYAACSTSFNAFGNHIDNGVRPITHGQAIGQQVRIDVSATLFLAEPDDYDDGELVVQTPAARSASSCPTCCACGPRLEAVASAAGRAIGAQVMRCNDKARAGPHEYGADE